VSTSVAETARDTSTSVTVTFALPGALQPFAGGCAEVACRAPRGTVHGALAALAGIHPGVVERVLDERSHQRRHVNLFVDGENTRFLHGLDTAVRDGAVITIVPAVSGG
jgi:molybdopterin synthase sulfur carrier subunit